MFELILKKVSDIKEYTDKHIKIPFIYILFLISIFLFFNTKFIDIINASEWVPSNIKDFLLSFVNLVYSQYDILIFLLLCIIIIVDILEKTNILQKILPKKVELINGTTVSWDVISAIKKLCSIGFQISTSGWIIYFFINVIFNEHNYVRNFFALENNISVDISYISKKNSEDMIGFFILNIIILLYHISKSLFEIKITSNIYYIKKDRIDMYHIINSFNYENTLKEKFQIILIKEKYAKKPKFLLAKSQITRFTYDENNNNLKDVNCSYKIIDSSENLSDIIYQFDALKEQSTTNDKRIVHSS